MRAIKLENVSKRFGAAAAVDGAGFTLEAGSFTALLGPSGCGKTTLLRLIAGFEQPDTGSIHFDATPVANANLMVPPERRNLGIVFQSYALWPHLDVAGNVGYPLKARRLGRAEIEARVARALDMVSLNGFEHRSIDALSGGQRQRVALARCLVTGTDIILLDEPLANLDVHLRAAMIDVFADLHRRTGATIVFVTHDQAEALALADRIVVLDKGKVQQTASPETLYSEPANPMVAGFVGRGALVRASVNDGGVLIGDVVVPTRGIVTGSSVQLLLRPQALRLTETGLAATVTSVRYAGEHYDTAVRLHGGEIVHLWLRHRLPLAHIVHITVEDSWVVPH